MLPTMQLPSVTGDEARKLVAEGATLLDVREDMEWNAGHAPEAQHAALSRLAAAPLDIDPSKPVVVVCRSGNRSMNVTAALVQHGVEAYNLNGGMHAWVQAGGGIVDVADQPGTVV